jgi:hypothetical protein
MRINADAETDIRDEILPHLSRLVKAAVTRGYAGLRRPDAGIRHRVEPVAMQANRTTSTD